MLNIGGQKNDAAYRYKMPRLETKTEGRGKNTKTVILNITAVAKALRCEAAHVAKHLGRGLCTQSSCDARRGRISFKGVHDPAVLADHLTKYIAKHVLCPTCRLPELADGACNSCGWEGGRSGNPGPAKSRLAKRRVAEKRVAEKRLAASRRSARDDRSICGAGCAGSRDMRDVGGDSAQAAETKREVVWHTDASAEARENRRQEEFETASKAPRTKTPALAAALVSLSAEECVAIVAREVKKRGLDPNARMNLVFEAVFGAPPAAPSAALAKIATCADFLAVYAAAAPKAFFVRLEQLLGTSRALEARTALAIKQLYDAEVLTEDQILEWYNSETSASCMRSKCEEFVDWLETAEEE